MWRATCIGPPVEGYLWKATCGGPPVVVYLSTCGELHVKGYIFYEDCQVEIGQSYQVQWGNSKQVDLAKVHGGGSEKEMQSLLQIRQKAKKRPAKKVDANNAKKKKPNCQVLRKSKPPASCNQPTASDTHTSQLETPASDTHTSQLTKQNTPAPASEDGYTPASQDRNITQTSQMVTRTTASDTHTSQLETPASDTHTSQNTTAPASEDSDVTHTAQNETTASDTHTSQLETPASDTHTSQNTTAPASEDSDVTHTAQNETQHNTPAPVSQESINTPTEHQSSHTFTATLASPARIPPPIQLMDIPTANDDDSTEGVPTSPSIFTFRASRSGPSVPSVQNQMFQIYRKMVDMERALVGVSKRLSEMSTHVTRIETKVDGFISRQSGASFMASDNNFVVNEQTAIPIPETEYLSGELAKTLFLESKGSGHFASKLLEVIYPELFGPENLRFQYNWNGTHGKRELDPARKTALKRYLNYFCPETQSNAAWAMLTVRINERLRRPVTKPRTKNVPVQEEPDFVDPCNFSMTDYLNSESLEPTYTMYRM